MPARLRHGRRAVENAKLHGELGSTLTEYRSLIERLPAVTYLDDLVTGETGRQPPDRGVVRGRARAVVTPTPGSGPSSRRSRSRQRGVRRCGRRAEPLRAEYRVVGPDGVVRWVVDHTVILPQVDGQPRAHPGLDLRHQRAQACRAELAHRANHDPLTGLPNRDEFRRRLDAAITDAQAGRHSLAVLYIDLDDFKLVNDSFGHEAGDQLLATIAERLCGAGRADVVGRDGGDEFLVLMTDLPRAPPTRREPPRRAARRPERAPAAPLAQRRRARHPRERRDQPVPVRRRRRPDVAPARRRGHVRSQDGGARQRLRLPTRRARRPGPARARRAPASGDHRRRARAALPADRRPRIRRHDGRRGARALERPDAA